MNSNNTDDSTADRAPNGFERIRAALEDTNLTYQERVLLAWLESRDYDGGAPTVSDPITFGQRKLAAALFGPTDDPKKDKANRDKIGDLLKRLEGKGYVLQRRRMRGRDDGRTSNEIVLFRNLTHAERMDRALQAAEQRAKDNANQKSNWPAPEPEDSRRTGRQAGRNLAQDEGAPGEKLRGVPGEKILVGTREKVPGGIRKKTPGQEEISRREIKEKSMGERSLLSAAPNGAASSEADKTQTRKHWEPLSLELKGAMDSRWPNAQEPADAALLAGALRDAAVGLPASVDRDAVVREAAERWMRSRAWRKSMDKPASIFYVEVGDIAAAVAKTPELNLADLDGIMSRGVIRNMDEGVRALRYWHMDEGGENYQSWGGWLNSSDSAKLGTIIEAYEDLDALRERYRASLTPVSSKPAPVPEPAPDPVAPTPEKSSPEEAAVTMITRKVPNQVRLEEVAPDPAWIARSAEWKRMLQAGGGRRPKVDLVKRKPLPLYQPVPLPPRKPYTAP